MFRCGAVILALAIGISGCFSKHSDDGNLSVFSYSHRDDVKTFDPLNAYDIISLDVVPDIYETLYQYSYLISPYKVEPLLADDLPKYSKDRLTVTIPIKRGIRFQDDQCFKAQGGKGRELHAQDFVYAIKRHALPALQSQGWWVFDGKFVGINAFHDKLLSVPSALNGQLQKIFEEPVEGIRAIDDYTLQLKLLKPYPQLLYVLSIPFTSPVAREAIDAYADSDGNLTDHPVGTGPFILKTWDRGRQIVLDRNPNYHKDFYPGEGSSDYSKLGFMADAGKALPFLDRIQIKVTKEEQPAWLNFMKGNEEVIVIPKDYFQQAIVKQVNLTPEFIEKGIKLGIDTGVSFYYISFNMRDKLLGNNKYLRQALSSAIDREKWIDIFTNGRGRKAVNALPPGIPQRPKNSRIKYDFDLKVAKELIKKAGFPDGKGLPVLNLDMRGADSVNRQLGDFFTKQFGEIGVTVNIIYNTFPAFIEKTKQANLQMFYGGWTMDYPDAENIFQLLYGKNQAPGPNDSNFDFPEMNKLYEEMASMENSTKRGSLIAQMDEILQEECPWALGYYNATYELVQPWVMNYRSSEIISNKYKYIRINKEIKKRYLAP